MEAIYTTNNKFNVDLKLVMYKKLPLSMESGFEVSAKNNLF